MKPIELYEREPITVSKEIGELKGFRYTHVPEIMEDLWGLDNHRISIRYYKDACIDGERRVWVLGSVWLDDVPVMVIQRAGREGDDHYKHFVTNSEKYKEMVLYIKDLLMISEEIAINEISANEDVKELVTFYGYSLDGDKLIQKEEL